MDALTPGRRALRFSGEHEHPPSCRPGLPVSRHRIFLPFRLQPPLVAPTDRFDFFRRAYRGDRVSCHPHHVVV